MWSLISRCTGSEMVAGVGQCIASAAAIPTMFLRRPFCRLPCSAAAAAAAATSAACITGSPISSVPSSSGRAQRIRNTWSCPVRSPSALPVFSNSLLMSGLKMSEVGALGSSSFSSSASAVAVTPEDVLEFWFEGVGPETGVYMRKEWFRGGPEFDGKCEEKFGECLKLFSTGALDGWTKTVRGRLALVILLDQISRNIHRNSPSSFAQDPAAIKITLDTIEQGWDKELTPSERHFLYMPLMHSENLRDHEIVDRLFEDLAKETSDNEKLHEQLLAVLKFERQHSAVLKRFGRYPSRNAVLGRPNTKEEEEFLASGGGW